MEHVITAVIIIFLLLFGMLTLSNAFIAAQATLEVSWEEMNTRSNEVNQTAISPVSLRVLDAGSSIEVTMRNTGTVKLADFDQWDVFTEYFDDTADSDPQEPPVYHAGRLTYNSMMASPGEWSVAGIFLDDENEADEIHDLNILNPGEALTLRLNVSPAVGIEQTAQVTVATQNGVTVSLMGMRNPPNVAPTLALNLPLKIASGSSAVIPADKLLAEDTDNDAAELTYTIIAPPAEGTLTPELVFTQAQIDANGLVYTHTAGDGDSFDFTITDGIAAMGPFTFSIAINNPPELETTNPGLVLPVGASATISGAVLHTTDLDPEDLPADLVYTVTQFPTEGMLSLGSTFSQLQIDNNALTYTHTAGDADADMFRFVVSDGYDVIGAYTFLITFVEMTEEAPVG